MKDEKTDTTILPYNLKKIFYQIADHDKWMLEWYKFKVCNLKFYLSSRIQPEPVL